MTNSSTPVIDLLTGNGDGTFQSAHSIVNAGPATSLSVGDFNNDGVPDLLATFPRQIGLFLGNGDGTFKNPQYLRYRFVSQHTTTGDFNGDGKLDFAASDANYGNVYVFLGNGDGTFQAPVVYPFYVADFMVTGDFNGDGTLDIVGIASEGSAGILLGNGDGTFRPVNYLYGWGVRPGWMIAQDINEDGNLDVLISNLNSLYGQSSPGQIVMFPGNGDGTFGDAVLITTPSISSIFAVLDGNGDGHLDLVVAEGASDDVAILQGDGTGNFRLTGSFATGSRTHWNCRRRL